MDFVFADEIVGYGIIKTIEDYVQQALATNDASHDWQHIDRVRNLALQLQRREGGNQELIEVAALLHDVEDAKYQPGGLAAQNQATVKPVKQFLTELFGEGPIFSTNLAPDIAVQMVLAIIKVVSFKNGLKVNYLKGAKLLGIELEARIVQDADRLDALGAIGIARTFNYAGRINRPIYRPEVDENKKIESMVNYQKYSQTPAVDDSTINHFYEKLFHLKDLMKTKTGRKLAVQRHNYMVDYVARLKAEYRGEI